MIVLWHCNGLNFEFHSAFRSIAKSSCVWLRCKGRKSALFIILRCTPPVQSSPAFFAASKVCLPITDVLNCIGSLSLYFGNCDDTELRSLLTLYFVRFSTKYKQNSIFLRCRIARKSRESQSPPDDRSTPRTTTATAAQATQTGKQTESAAGARAAAPAPTPATAEGLPTAATEEGGGGGGAEEAQSAASRAGRSAPEPARGRREAAGAATQAQAAAASPGRDLQEPELPAQLRDRGRVGGGLSAVQSLLFPSEVSLTSVRLTTASNENVLQQKQDGNAEVEAGEAGVQLHQSQSSLGPTSQAREEGTQKSDVKNIRSANQAREGGAHQLRHVAKVLDEDEQLVAVACRQEAEAQPGSVRSGDGLRSEARRTARQRVVRATKTSEALYFQELTKCVLVGTRVLM